jgi:hypothetical protein
MKPVSSTNAMTAWRRRPFFYPRPRNLAPVLDGGLVALACPTFRLLAGPAQLPQNLSDVAGMIVDFEVHTDDFGDARRSISRSRSLPAGRLPGATSSAARGRLLTVGELDLDEAWRPSLPRRIASTPASTAWRRTAKRHKPLPLRRASSPVRTAEPPPAVALPIVGHYQMVSCLHYDPAQRMVRRSVQARVNDHTIRNDRICGHEV